MQSDVTATSGSTDWVKDYESTYSDEGNCQSAADACITLVVTCDHLGNVAWDIFWTLRIIWIEYVWINRRQFISDKVPYYRKACTTKALSQSTYSYTVLDGCAEGPAVNKTVGGKKAPCIPKVCVCTDDLCNTGSGAFHLRLSSPVLFFFSFRLLVFLVDYFSLIIVANKILWILDAITYFLTFN